MLQLQNVSFAYPGGARIAFPNTDVPQGGVLLLQGASGSGKSTLLALSCALLGGVKGGEKDALRGELHVAGQEVSLLRGAARDAWRGRTVGFLPQRLHLSESLTVRGNLELVFFAAGLCEDAAKIEAALLALCIADLAARRPSALSGGQAQRVALARAVLLEPKIILADEPTASLDDAAAEQSVALLLESAARCGATLVVATHDARVRLALAAYEQKSPGAQQVQHMVLQNLSQIDACPANTVRQVL